MRYPASFSQDELQAMIAYERFKAKDMVGAESGIAPTAKQQFTRYEPRRIDPQSLVELVA